LSFDPDTAAIRFGMGLGPGLKPPGSVDEMIRVLRARDAAAMQYPIPRFMSLLPDISRLAELQKDRRRTKDKARLKVVMAGIRDLRRSSRSAQAEYLKASVARGVFSADGFRERLTRFWADHFTVKGKNGILKTAVSTYVEEAIRPHLTAPYSQLLAAAVTHPMMLLFLDQVTSAGPGSRMAKRRSGRGLNENLAREVLELHTLGVDGAYTQADVRQLAELFTGMTASHDAGFVFRPGMAEPGAETVLGKSYGGGRPGMDDIRAFLDDVAVHPDTGAHIARKLVRHFVADDPDPALVDHVAARFAQSGGDLTEVYEAMLNHPLAWVTPDRKTKQPFDFVVSSLRALGVPEDRLMRMKPRQVALYLGLPMQVMGQSFENPTGPDGWPEEAEAWITPQGIAGRIQWAMTVPHVARLDLPDPRVFLDVALGARASAALEFAAKGAATKWEGIGLILASPEFQRR